MNWLPHCQQVLRRSRSSFAPAFLLLGNEARAAMTAFYAFCRQVDDAVDEAPSPEEARRVLGEWREGLQRVANGGPRGPIEEGLAFAVQRFGVRPEVLNLVLDGVESDLTINRYPTFQDLYRYCYQVASSVGLFTVAVLGEDGAEVRRYAEWTGVGVQLINILRDVSEDAARGRLYLPQEDCARFSVPEEEVLAGRDSPRLRRLLRFEAARARALLEMADRSLTPDQRRRLIFAQALRNLYMGVLEDLEEADFAPHGPPKRPGLSRVVSALSRAVVEGYRVR